MPHPLGFPGRVGSEMWGVGTPVGIHLWRVHVCLNLHVSSVPARRDTTPGLCCLPPGWRDPAPAAWGPLRRQVGGRWAPDWPCVGRSLGAGEAELVLRAELGRPGEQDGVSGRVPGSGARWSEGPGPEGV